MSAGADGRTSLTRAEAVARAGAVRVEGVEVSLDLTDEAGPTFGSRSVIRFSSSAPETFVDFAGEELTSAVLNGRALDLAGWSRARIPLTGLQADNVLEVEGRMGYSSDGEGLHRHVDPADGRTYLYAMSFLDAAPRWFACFDQPDLKARCTFDVTAPVGWTVLGNGPAEVLEPDQVRGGSGGSTPPPETRRWRIVAPQPLSTYTTPMTMNNPVGNGRPVTYIRCTVPGFDSAAPGAAYAKTRADWQYLESPTAHDAMVTEPARLTDMLAALA